MPFSTGARRLVQLKDLDLQGQSQGDILIRDPALWKRLAASSGGQFLKTQGPGANPLWAAVATALDIDGQSSVNGAAGAVLGHTVGASGEYSIASVSISTTVTATLVGVGMAQNGNAGGEYRLYLDSSFKASVSATAYGFYVLKWINVNTAPGSHTLDLRMWADPGAKATIYVVGRGIFLAGIKAS